MNKLLSKKRQEEIEKIATTILRNYKNIKSIPELINKITQDENIQMYESPLGEINGFLKKEENNWTITLNTHDSMTRKAFSAAHELGHYFLHRSEQNEFIDGSIMMRRQEKTKYQTQEIEANEFAACLIMPKEKIQIEFSHNITPQKIEEVASEFGVSNISLSTRLKNLGYPIPQQKTISI